MKPVSSKRMVRIEKKKKKMTALWEVSKLNELDRKQKTARTMIHTERDETTCLEAEPSPKRLRTDEAINQNREEIIGDTELGPSGKPKLSGEDFIKLKKLLRETTTKMRATPKFWLRDQGEHAMLSVDCENRAPLFMSDIQHLIMYSQLGHHSPYTPARWCQLEKFNKLINTNVLIIDNISLYQFTSNESLFPYLSSTFKHKLEVLTPSAYKGNSVQDLAAVPLTSTQMRKYLNQFGSLEAAVTASQEVFDLVKNVFPFEPKTDVVKNSNLPDEDKFPRTHILLSGWQMVEENFPLPIKGLMERKYNGYVLTKDTYNVVTPQSPLFGMDCEMCKTTSGDLELTRISIVNEKLEIFYEQLVKPDNKIIDYLTRYSGITPKLMKPITKKLKDVQEDLRKILPPDAILVGQSLNNDLHALKMMHPYIIDTSVIFNITGIRMRKTKLQTLAREFLSEKIQQDNRLGHCSIEDSSTSLKLVKLKLSKDIYYGDAVMSNVQLQIRKHPELGNPNYATSMLKQTTRMEKTAYIVGLEDITAKYTYFTFKEMEAKSDKKIMFVSEKSSKAVVKNVVENSFNNSLNIGHVKILDTQYESDSNKVFKDIDKWVKDMYEQSAKPSLNIVIFGGHKDTGNGCCFINLKT